ncbi:ATP-binding protein [Sphingomonas sp.]|uniref:tetratricopeptide repeat-containing sensor histidine kinase n=1 Tax=Sphingomonas sp. TaxID=28214 RepID=UPI001B144677|nr:ATP-binding protein [Sphingomonas sp.]MBO9712668.1 histidine kinase [Sphingomonas sp.]
MRRKLRLALLLLGCSALVPAAARAQAPSAASSPLPQPRFSPAIEDAFARAKAAMMEDPREVLRHVADAERLAAALPDERTRSLVLATGYWLAAEAHLRSGEPDLAAPLLARGLKLIAPIQETLKLRGDLLMSQGSLFVDRDQASEALGNYHQAYRTFVAAREPRSQAIALQNIALLYLGANDFANAQKYFAEAAGAYDGDPQLSMSLHNNLGNTLLRLDLYDAAEAEYLKALEIARANGSAVLEARVLGNIARGRVEARRLAAAEQALSEGFALARGADAHAVRLQLSAVAARVAMERGDLARARQLIDEVFAGVDLSKTSSAYLYPHTVAYLVYEKLGEDALALRHLEAKKRLDDEAAKVATTTGAALMSAQFDSANKDAKIANLRAEQIAKSAEFQRALFLYIGGATLVIILLLTVALFVIRRSRNQVRAANIVLGETNFALEKALKAKTEFLATTSHEIRTPLNGILGMTQVMLSDPRIEPATRDRIGIVHGAGVTMRALVDDILDLAKMETGNLTVETAPTNLPAVLRDVTRMWEEQARAKGLGFVLDLEKAPGWIVSDSARLRQIVFNLLSNAIKFTAAGQVGLSAVAEGGRLRLVVTDSGIGIPQEKLDEIFESFKQVDTSTTRKFGGTGLGLAICRNLARALGGDISVESREGEGSRFIVDMPMTEAEAPAESVAAKGGEGTLLVLDRNPIARAMLKTLLEPRVGTLRFLATLDEAVAALGDGADEILVDEGTLKAQDGDPTALLRQLADAAAAAGAASAVLWVKPDDAIRTILLDAGVGQVIDKPVNGPALIKALVTVSKGDSDEPSPGALVSRAA